MSEKRFIEKVQIQIGRRIGVHCSGRKVVFVRGTICGCHIWRAILNRQLLKTVDEEARQLEAEKNQDDEERRSQRETLVRRIHQSKTPANTDLITKMNYN